MNRVLDLFSGIGGFSLGLERTGGFRTVAFCEIDPFCRRVLKKHWPEVPCYDDVRQLTAERLAADGIGVDVICGGFPCQDISVAGKGAGLEGERSGLWSEIARLSGELRPRFVIVENVSALLSRGLDRVLGDLAALGFDAEWHCIPASAVGAPHRRDRFWLVAYAEELFSDGREHNGRRHQEGSRSLPELGNGRGHAGILADADKPRLEGWLRDGLRECADERAAWARGASVADTSCELSHGAGTAGPGWWRQSSDCRWWLSEPNVGRVAHGVPSRVDRLRALGNAVVPQVVTLIGRTILAAEAR